MINANRLKEIRKKLGRTQHEVAQYIGITQNAYSYWENGKVKIDNESLKKLSDYFNVSIDYLLGRDIESAATQHTKWTDEENEQGIGQHPITLSSEEWDWLELRSELIRTMGEEYQNTVKKMLEEIVKKNN